MFSKLAPSSIKAMF
ncbi:hypothetical protein PSZ80_01435 [Shigella sonnei]|nr:MULTISPECIES: hypothetical protein [Enterobacteriaceae]EHJ4618463.1 hypothetical protein [Shigella flexneri]EHJ5031913.1 hypothetical protein [Shigella flexneri]EHJ8030294.1 hypothetical protein [Escherichia coli]EHJ9027680.1 hypothetical protein [Escherichia coli]EHJ9036045.1 hypothetical protein [Escherichia coli]